MGGGASKQTAKKPQEKQKQKPPPKKDITAQEKAILDLKNQRDKLHRYRKQACRKSPLLHERVYPPPGLRNIHDAKMVTHLAINLPETNLLADRAECGARNTACAGGSDRREQTEGVAVFKEEEVPRESFREGREAAGQPRGDGVFTHVLLYIMGIHANTGHVQLQVNAIEFASMEKEVFVRLKEGRDMLEAINKEMDVAEIEKMLDDTKEAIEYQNVCRSRNLPGCRLECRATCTCL